MQTLLDSGGFILQGSVSFDKAAFHKQTQWSLNRRYGHVPYTHDVTTFCVGPNVLA